MTHLALEVFSQIISSRVDTHDEPASLVGTSEETDRLGQDLTLQSLRGLVLLLPAKCSPEVIWKTRRNVKADTFYFSLASMVFQELRIIFILYNLIKLDVSVSVRTLFTVKR